MKAGLISDEPVWVAFALFNLGGRANHWAYTMETTSPGCFASWTQLGEQLRAAFLPTNNAFRQRSRFLACKQGKRELQECAQEMCTLVASLAGNSLHEDVRTTVFMDGLKVGPASTQLFRLQATTMEEAIPIALQEEHSHKQAGTSREEEHRHDENGVPQEAEHRSNDAVAPAVTQLVDTGAYSEPKPMDLSSAESLVLWMRRTWPLPACVSLASPREEDSPWTSSPVAQATARWKKTPRPPVKAVYPTEVR
ncbi:hypothetical protein PInf_025761 [Phytophthora infestans]|nr:hypothetical protein PInf_025761 [Phytophthora infestans]